MYINGIFRESDPEEWKGPKQCKVCGFLSDQDTILVHNKSCLGFFAKIDRKWIRIDARTIKEAEEKARAAGSPCLKIPDGSFLSIKTGNMFFIE